MNDKPCYIMGDFNYNLLSIEANNNCEKFTDIMHSNSFFPLIDKPTRIQPPSSTLIDNIFTNCPQHGHTSGIVYTDISDHLPIFSINDTLAETTGVNEKTYQYRSLNEANNYKYISPASSLT
eukprot:GHVO01042820.1.p1 GENE.GHVO01042820.1~~GHVO01042820.1.p1  ORF type:complete len:122 (+),score=0.84 GHVO01042820.1:77-442(+)